MARIDIIAIEEEARRLRAEDLRRGGPLFAERIDLCASLYAESLRPLSTLINRLVRPLFSWNPRQHRAHLS
jgi:hypothetical protein